MSSPNAENQRKHFQPIVFDHIQLLDFIQYLLDHHTDPTTLIICSSRDQFLQQLLASIEHSGNDNGDPRTGSSQPKHHLFIPTLRLLSQTRTINLAFTPHLAAIRAYFSSYSLSETTSISAALPAPLLSPAPGQQQRRPFLALLNPIALHRDTSSFSAQGLSRTLASVVELAWRTKQRLVITECAVPSPSSPAADGGLAAPLRTAHADADMDAEMDAGMPDANAHDHSAEPTEGETTTAGSTVWQEPPSPWDEKVAILNVTTRTFGAGERGWVGRTMKLRNVAERW
ncbi:hypothetical protein LTS18_009631, partial [Coniosporium uncinatum]